MPRFFSFLNDLHTKPQRVLLEMMPLIVVMAAVWHVGMSLLVRRTSRPNRPSLSNLLITAEREALQTLRNELVQRFPKNSRALKEKLKEVDRRLKEIENENHG